MFYKNQTKSQLRYMKKHKKVLKIFTRLNPKTKKQIQWAKIKVPNVPVKVITSHLRVNHIYEVPKKDLNNPKLYLDPANDLDYNTHKDFDAYRKKLGLLSPSFLQDYRYKKHLSKQALAKHLHIPLADYSLIESGNIAKEKEWYAKLFPLVKAHQHREES